MLKGHSVLIIDDQPLVLNILRGMLTKLGCTSIFDATNGDDAKRVFSRAAPTIIISDINMEPGNGLNFLHDLRQGTFCQPDIPLIFLSGASDADTIHKAMEMGANDYIVKPISLNQFSEKINNVIRKRWPGTESRKV